MPFNNSLENQGLDNDYKTVGTAQYATGGKVITNYLSTSNQIYLYPTNFSQYTQLAMSFWLYVDSSRSADWADVVSIIDGSNNLRCQACNNTCHIIGFFNNTGYKIIPSNFETYNITNHYNEWMHVCLTTENDKISYYVNGEKISTRNLQDNWNSDISRITFYNTHKLHLCDFKLWDNSLSLRQVKEISKGLICHYPLGEIDGKIGGRNLIKNGKGNVKAGFFKNFPTVTNEYAEFTLKSKKTYAIINLSDGFVYGCRDYPVGEKYTWSYDIMYTAWNFPTGSNRGEFWMGQRYANAPSGETATGAWRNVTLHNLPVVGQNGCELNKWYHVKQTVTIPQQASSNVGQHGAISFYNSNANVEASFTARIKNIKLEKSSTATPWTPAPEDDASFYDNVIYDTSGYCNNGSVTDATCPTWSSDTPRYKGSYVFNGNNQYLKFQNPITSSSTDFTISCWVKFDDTTGNSTICTMRTAVGNGIALFKIGNKIRFDDNAQFTFSDYTISANAWTHVVVTRLSSCKKLYVNGILKQTVNTVGDMKLISNVGTIGASSQGGDGISNYLNGQLSDFRIYATALSDSDILELYQSSASVDNNGNLMLAGEVMEE